MGDGDDCVVVSLYEAFVVDIRVRSGRAFSSGT